MCGIVGAVGHDRCGPVLLDALKRLEYRGYDSSGIVTLHEGQIDFAAGGWQTGQSGDGAGGSGIARLDWHRPYKMGNTWRGVGR